MKSSHLTGIIAIALAIIGTLFASPNAYALNFVPSETEWATWPDYCRARYVVSGAGAKSAFATRVSRAEVSRQMARMSNDWNWLHHNCAAMVYLSRAKAEETARRKEYWLTEAENNFMGYYQRVNRESQMYIDVALNIAKVHRSRGNSRTALEFLDEAINEHPLASSPYALASLIHKDNGDIDKAVSVLLQGIRATDGDSAELHYFLGLMYIELNDIDSAVEHAQSAYRLGYPLPGLASKLRKLGRAIK